MRQLKITNQITNRESDSLEKYLHDIAKIDLIDADEEVRLATLIKEGDKIAEQRLIQANLRFVVSVAKQYQNQGLALADLINEGNLGLIKAANRFDETRGFKFISYAVWWIRQSIMQAIVEQARMVRLPLNKVGCYNKYNRFLSDFEQEHGRKPTPEEVQEIGGIKVSDVKEISKSGKRHLSMDAPLQAGENMTMMDTLSDNGYMKPDRELMDESLKEEILEVLGVVSGRESDILRCYYGLNDKPPLTLEEIGQEFGLTRERVRQIKERAIRRLRKTSVCRSLRGYLD